MAEVFAQLIARQGQRTPRLRLRRPAMFEPVTAAPAPVVPSAAAPRADEPAPDSEPRPPVERPADEGPASTAMDPSLDPLRPQQPESGPRSATDEQPRGEPDHEFERTAAEPTTLGGSEIVPPLTSAAPAPRMRVRGSGAADGATTAADVGLPPMGAPVSEEPAAPAAEGGLRPWPVEDPAEPVPLRSGPPLAEVAHPARGVPRPAVPAPTPPPVPDAVPVLTAEELLRRHFAPALVEAGHLSAGDSERLVSSTAGGPRPDPGPRRWPVRWDPVDVPASGEVHVHIDRVEITRPEPPATTRAPEAPAKIDHTAYLKRQARRS